ncbi:hypothetical protein [Actinoplanes sp. NPDC023714]|uniref:hypothetical protein n=1 Tax=Actinoplanes sp. NPDC023714 TaxID=3154322 RepID=UPI003400D2C0
MSCLTVIEAGGPHAIIVRGPALEIIDLTSGASAGSIPTGLARITAVAGAELDGRPIAICVANERLHGFDLASGEPLEATFAGAGPQVITAGVMSGRPVLIGGTGTALRRWDIATGTEIGGPLEVHRAPITALALVTVAGRPTVISADGSGVIQRSDLATGEEAGEPFHRPGGPITALAAAEVDDEVVIAIGDGGDLSIAAAGTWTGSAPEGGPIAGPSAQAGGSPAEAGGSPAQAGGSSAQAGGSPVQAGGSPAQAGGSPAQAGGSPAQAGGSSAQAGGPSAQAGGSSVRIASVEEVAAAAVASVDGRPALITLGHDESVRGWSLPDAAPVGRPWADETVSITAVAIAHAGGRPIAISGDGDGTLRRWDLSTLTPLGDRIQGHSAWVRAIATTRLDGRTVAVTAADRTLRIWDLETGAPAGATSAPAAGDADGTPIDTRYQTTVLTSATWNGMTIAVCLHSDGRTRAWDLATGKLAAGPLQEWAGARAFAQVGEVIYAVTEDHPYDEESASYDVTETALRAWDLSAGTVLGQAMIGGGHGGTVTWPPVKVVEFGGRPVIVSGAGDDGRLRLWDLTTGELLTEPLAGHDGELTAVAAIVHEERLVVVSGGEDGTLRIWDQGRGTRLTGHTGRITAVALDGTQVVSASDDGTLRVWDLMTGSLKARFRAR